VAVNADCHQVVGFVLPAHFEWDDVVDNIARLSANMTGVIIPLKDFFPFVMPVRPIVTYLASSPPGIMFSDEPRVEWLEGSGIFLVLFIFQALGPLAYFPFVPWNFPIASFGHFFPNFWSLV